MAKEFKASQNVYFVGKVLSGKVEEKESKSNITYKKYSVFVKLPEGTTITIEKLRFPKKEGKVESDYEIKAYKEFEDIISRVTAKQDVYISKSIFKQKDKDQFDWLTTYENDEGKLTYKVSGFINELKYYLDGEKVMLKFKESDGEFDSIDSKFEVKMFVTDIEDNKIYLTDGKTEYPNVVIVTVPSTIENKAKVGQAYTIKIKPIKGKKAKLQEGDTNWDNEGVDGYLPDTYELSAVEKIDATLDVGGITSDDLGF